jgi:predicted acylesterase/phospholipase RssA
MTRRDGDDAGATGPPALRSWLMMMRAIAAVQLQPLLLGAPSRPIESCFGGGGAFGIGFEMGVVSGLLDGGIPVDKGPMLGTSAGAWTAASVAVGITYDQLVEVAGSHGRTGDPARVIDITRSVFGDGRDGRVTGMAIQLPYGVRRSLSGCSDRSAGSPSR